MKTFFAILALAIMACAPAMADPLLITLDSATLTGAPGGIVNFSGTITNTTGSQVFLNFDNFNLSLAGATIDDSPFFNNAPLSLGAFGSSGDVALFNITIPGGAANGPYSGEFDILGGATSDDQTIVGLATFTVDVEPVGAVPEPGTFSLLGCGLIGLGLVVRRTFLHKKR